MSTQFNSSNIDLYDSGFSRKNEQGSFMCVVWLTGLSGAGKSTIANELDRKFSAIQVKSVVLDGDHLRNGINADLGFSREDRAENVRRIGHISKLFFDTGIVTLVACISPYRNDREMVKKIFKEGTFIEVFVKCHIDECMSRDPKGLYSKVIEGKITQFTGISSPYEEPETADIVVDTQKESLEQCTEKILNFLLKKQSCV
ncbi:adenylyl-sulfate kinase [Paenibacillus sp. NPDC057967]|uniref:adenylyl-sulfate kinase n=1 Tax=Paenibacillus sp. NPDC057967 TaxID=3346293 RepID=UPI0036DB4E1F